MDKKPELFLAKVAFAVFIYSVFAMMAYQIGIIEYMSDTASNGLLAGDPQYYHRLSVDVSEKITSEGWGAWRLRPDGQGSAGLLSILYYFVGPYPWLVILINSLSHALASVFLIIVLNRVVSVRYASIASLYFIVSPFQMHWLSQINKESYVILGVFVFFYGVVLFCERKRYHGCVGLCWMLVGAAIISIARPYIVQILFIASIMLGLLTIFFSIKKNELRGMGFSLLVFSLLFIPLMSGGESDRIISAASFSDNKLTSSFVDEMASDYLIEGTNDIVVRKYSIWFESDWLPKLVDEKLFAISFSRMPYELLKNSPNATIKALILTDEAEFHSASDIILYLPRALQVSLFAPFPTYWPLFSDINDGSTFRLMTSIELFIAYISFIFLAYGLYRYRLWKFSIPIFYMLFVLQVYGFAIPHIGTLYRYKYSYFILLVSLGLALFFKCWAERRIKFHDITHDKEGL